MITISKVLAVILILLVQPALPQETDFTKDGLVFLKSNLEFLASDLLEGREAATRGTQLASAFIASELKKYGVKPFGDDNTYFQNFNLLAKKYDKKTGITITSEDSSENNLLIGSDFYISKDKLPSLEYCYKEKEIVFAGYGLDADNYNDYKNLDVRDKMVLVLPGLPKQDSLLSFSDEDAKTFKSDEYKLQTAQDLGASGIFLFPSTRTVKYWKYLKSRAVMESVSIYDGDGEILNVDDGAIPFIRLSENAATDLLKGEAYDYQSLKKVLEEKIDIKQFTLQKRVVLNYKYSVSLKQARNVIGLIEGNDNELENQYVTMSAHYDHEGVVNGKIYNGADDDGSGTVAILESARRLSLLDNNRRSVLIIFHTGEEKGLLGSKYLTNNSRFMKDIVVNINVDMVGREGTDSIYCIGSDKLSTELFNLVEEVNNETAGFTLDYKYNDPDDPNRYYYRSDHYNYAKQNIPIVFFYDHMTEDYHKPTDDVEKINFPKIEKCATLITELALRISNLDHRLVVDKPHNVTGFTK